ncbi:MAG: DUF5691 domain-containing protein [Betaproteobacteria bacterium]
MTQGTPAWAPLLPIAMVGTRRYALPPPAWPGPIGAAIAALDAAAAGDDDPAPARLLRCAAILATCGLAGACPAPHDAELPTAAEDAVSDVVADPAFIALLGGVLRDGPLRLQVLFLQGIAQAGRTLPHALLPAALALARGSIELRPAVERVLGERGLWLARQREEWSFAAGVLAADDDPRQWSEGTLARRKAFLLAERARAPGAARERLAAALPEMGAAERAELTAVLALNLSDADEPLLDTLRADRGRDVRDAALRLLLRLPEAAHSQRAATRLAALLTSSPGLTGRRWTLAAPEAPAPDWKADQVEAVRPQNALGERAWWLYQLARQVPLAWWTAHTGMSQSKLRRWADDGDWADALWRAWMEVLADAPDLAWAETLLEDWPARLAAHDRVGVVQLLPLERRERWWKQDLEAADGNLSDALWRIARALPAGTLLSPALSALAARRLQASLAAEPPAGVAESRWSERHGLTSQLPELSCLLTLESLADFAHWPRHADEPAPVGAARHHSLQILGARRALAAFPSSDPS